MSAGSSSWHAAFWDKNQVIDIGTLGGEVSGATGVNDLGQVIGRSERAPGGDRVFYGFFWDGERIYDVRELVTGSNATLLELNNCGEVLVPGTRRSDEGFYVYHTEGGLRPVRGVFGPATGWWELIGWDMNDRGEIVGLGQLANGVVHGFLVAPLRGDLDWDGDADLHDWAEFAARFTGPMEPDIPGCQRADMDRDADVDLDDFTLLQKALSGPR